MWFDSDALGQVTRSNSPDTRPLPPWVEEVRRSFEGAEIMLQVPGFMVQDSALGRGITGWNIALANSAGQHEATSESLPPEYNGRRAKVISLQFTASKFAVLVQLKTDPYQPIDGFELVAQFDDGTIAITKGTAENIRGDTLACCGFGLMSVMREREALRRAAEEAARALREGQEKAHEQWIRGLRWRNIPIWFTVDFSVDSAGGVSPRFEINNVSDRRIKYVNVTLVPFNAVGDVATNTIGGSGQFTTSLVGPIEVGAKGVYDYRGSPPHYNRTTRCIEVRRVVVEFMDGTSFTMVNDLGSARPDRPTPAHKINGECRVQ